MKRITIELTDEGYRELDGMVADRTAAVLGLEISDRLTKARNYFARYLGPAMLQASDAYFRPGREQAFAAGRLAFQQGRHCVLACPANVDELYDWHSGWHSAQHEAENQRLISS